MTDDKALVIALFPDEAAADSAAQALKDTGLAAHDALAVLVLDERGKLKEEKVGARSTAAGAGIGAGLALLGPIGIGLGVLGGAAAGALHHKKPKLSDADLARIGTELASGKAAVAVLTDVHEWGDVSAKLAELGGMPEQYAVPAKTLSAAADVDVSAQDSVSGLVHRP